MQDRFIYKIWDKELKQMYELSLSDIAEPDEYWYDGENSCWYVFNDAINEQKRFIILQCTGLEDKNKKLIFEGDILENISGTLHVRYIVKWDKHQAKFYITKINPDKHDNWKDWHLGRHDLDYIVIGNIYENPELLK